MVRAIEAANIKKLHQTEDTSPFLHPPLVQDFGAYGELEATNEVLEVTYAVVDTIDRYTKEFLKQCKQEEIDREQEYSRTPEDFKISWTKMNERTSSNKSLHFGHFRAGVLNPSILMTHYLLAEIPFQSRYTLNRWLSATNVMLLKSQGLYDMNKLQTIVL